MKMTKEILKQFNDWKKAGNVCMYAKGMYSTQDAQFRNQIYGLHALKIYFMKEFIN